MDNQTASIIATPDRSKKLMNLSRQVLEKVKNGGVTTGNQIAKEILKDYSDSSYEVEFKNIQRRVYDALNVLHALNIISKIRNEISYQGLSNDKEIGSVRGSLNAKKAMIEEKRKALTENLLHFIALHKLLNRNMAQETKPNVLLPCVVVRGREMNIDVQEDSIRILSENPVMIYNDAHLLANMKFHHFTASDLSDTFPIELLNAVTSQEENEVRTEEKEVKEKDYRELYIDLLNKNQCIVRHESC
ncbi:unnamed protein product [Blepharisma stoltei]|uniref:E2F/DP family winged-helix DNA-binding domain-containing protein n=1 Tax=Blepharisma stoltei TaxID=1481888 RepID=A0AAU9KDR9_9CILI|nr:unnamed protein product [Blepharisma stoltei]